ncbi:unnamed protein product, partial [Allacma fusca]
TEDNRFCCTSDPGLLDSNVIKIVLDLADCVREGLEGTNIVPIIAGVGSTVALLLGIGVMLICVLRRKKRGNASQRTPLWKTLDNRGGE